MEENGGKRLVRSCIGHLNKIQGVTNGENRALYPVIMVFFGKEVEDPFTTIRDTLDDNWQNADYLKYLNIVKEEQGFTCSNLVTGECSDDPIAFAEAAVVEMLGMDDYVFENTGRIRFEFILSGEDEDAVAYYDFMVHMRMSSQYSIFKTMFIMMDESGLEKRRRIRKLLKYITESRNDTRGDLGTLYLLSNFLKNGKYLLKHRIALNYRLVADLILLGGNRGSDGNNRSVTSVETYDTIKTAAYALVEKPIRNITIISLRKMMRQLMEQNERSYKETAGDSMRQAEKIEKKLGIQPGKITCLETMFQEYIIRNFPQFEELQYLAYLSEQECKNVHKEKRITQAGLDRATGGNWSLFYEENYKRKVEGLLSDERFLDDCMSRIEKDWRSVLSYGDALYGLEDGRVSGAIEELVPASAVAAGNSIEEGIHFGAVAEAKKVFYAFMVQKLAKLLSQIHQDALRFEKLYKNLEDEVRREDIDDSETKKDIQSYYEHLTENFLRKTGEQITAEIFHLRNDVDKIIRSLEQVFKRLIGSEDIYRMSFEQEMQTRLNTMSDIDRILRIKNVLETRIEDLVRLHWNSTSYENNIRGIYYLMNKDAEYARELDESSSQFTLFHLKRTDCIEKIAIYDLDNPSEYCNLIEMAGEA